MPEYIIAKITGRWQAERYFWAVKCAGKKEDTRSLKYELIFLTVSWPWRQTLLIWIALYWNWMLTEVRLWLRYWCSKGFVMFCMETANKRLFTHLQTFNRHYWSVLDSRITHLDCTCQSYWCEHHSLFRNHRPQWIPSDRSHWPAASTRQADKHSTELGSLGFMGQARNLPWVLFPSPKTLNPSCCSEVVLSER